MKVSALCVTHVRRELADAVRSFKLQTYHDLELVIVIDDPKKERSARMYECDNIRVVLDTESKTLGELRNRSVREAQGDIIIQWDDDDISGPERVRTQVEALVDSGKDACMLRTELFQFKDSVSLVKDHPFEGAICCYREWMPEYPALTKGEDTKALPGHRGEWEKWCVYVDDLHYLRRYHGENTWDEDHYERITKNLSVAPNPSDGIQIDRFLDWVDATVLCGVA